MRVVLGEYQVSQLESIFRRVGDPALNANQEVLVSELMLKVRMTEFVKKGLVVFWVVPPYGNGIKPGLTSSTQDLTSST